MKSNDTYLYISFYKALKFDSEILYITILCKYSKLRIDITTHKKATKCRNIKMLSIS